MSTQSAEAILDTFIRVIANPRYEGRSSDIIKIRQFIVFHSASIAERESKTAELAERFWRVHPREIQDLGIDRQEFYRRKMVEAFVTPQLEADDAEI
jgi:hypothetical protein